MVLPTTQGITWQSKQDAYRGAAIGKWSSMLGKFPKFFSVTRGIALDADQGRRYSLETVLEQVFALKATSTLHGRAGPLARYLRFCALKQVPVFPIDESGIYLYMSSVADSSAATYLKSFLGTMAFIKHVLGADVDDTVFNPRVYGIASLKFLEKRKLQQRPPLTVFQVKALEETLAGIIDGIVNRTALQLGSSFLPSWLVRGTAMLRDAGIFLLTSIQWETSLKDFWKQV